MGHFSHLFVAGEHFAAAASLRVEVKPNLFVPMLHLGVRSDACSRVSVALTAGRNISPTFSNFDEKPGANGFQNKAGFIQVSWNQGCDPLVLFAVGWRFLRGSSPCLPATGRYARSAWISPCGLISSGASLPRREAPPL